MSVKQTIEQKLKTAFAPSHLEVIDESHLHKGHGGYREEGESHFRIKIMAKSLEEKSRIMQHRAVNEILADELTEQIHALAIEIKRTS